MLKRLMSPLASKAGQWGLRKMTAKLWPRAVEITTFLVLCTSRRIGIQFAAFSTSPGTSSLSISLYSSSTMRSVSGLRQTLHMLQPDEIWSRSLCQHPATAPRDIESCRWFWLLGYCFSTQYCQCSLVSPREFSSSLTYNYQTVKKTRLSHW